MYSYTLTGINNIYPTLPQEPQLRIICKCQRKLIQEEIYTCISCTEYCCHYCTLPDIIFFQCRNCKSTSESTKTSKCKMCFSCPYCSNVLVMNRNVDKKHVMWCQYCYWTSKEINIATEKSEDLIESLNRFSSSSLQNTEDKIYNATQGLFKEITTLVDHENQSSNYSTSARKTYKRNQEELLQDSKNQIEKTCELLIKRLGLDDNHPEYDGDIKLPQNLPLQAKKTRRCPKCKKPLTTSFKSRTGEYKIELMYKELKLLQCQVKPAVDQKVKIKCLKDLVLEGDIECKTSDVKEVPINTPFKAKVKILNRTKETTSEVEYDLIVLCE